MDRIISILEQRLCRAIRSVTDIQNANAMLRPTTDTKFGDYQSNAMMSLSKQVGKNPRQLAAEVASKLEISDICLEPEIAGPGFLNFKIRPEFLASRILELHNDKSPRLAIARVQNPKRVIVDFSGPNIAKQMHVGHLRSTILGDAICRLLEFEGHEVIRQNHVGDWGTQFGMLIAYMRERINLIPEYLKRGEQPPTAFKDLEDFYKKAKARYDTDLDFAEKSRECVVKLQSHDTVMKHHWKEFVDQSRRHYQPIYESLGINLNESNERGESFYADMLPGVVEELKAKGLATISDGALCVFPAGFVTKEGTPLPLIVQKSDGAFLYATTDLAALRYRIDHLKADHIIYITDARQSLHFEMVFAVARLAGWVPAHVKLEHVTFGSVLGEDGKPFKTRSGESVKLKDLINEAVIRARKVVEEKNPELPDDKKSQIAHAVGIGAIKYADFANNRTSDYVFSFDRMLAMEGNTAPYMQYAYARIKSIERKAGEKGVDVQKELAAISAVALIEPAEIELAKQLAKYDESIYSASVDLRPNYLTGYLYDLAGEFSAFYNQCQVLSAQPQSLPTRLLLCDLTAKTIKHGLSNLLGIDVVEQM